MEGSLRIELKDRVVVIKGDTLLSLATAEEGILVAEAIRHYFQGSKTPLPETVGFVGEDFPLLANLSVQENALLPVLWHGIMSKDRAMERFSFLADRLNLWDLRHERKDALTEEQLFRAGLLRAMMAGPEWLFIDFGTSERQALGFVPWFRGLFPEERARLVLSVVSASVCPEGFEEVRLSA